MESGLSMRAIIGGSLVLLLFILMLWRWVKKIEPPSQGTLQSLQNGAVGQNPAASLIHKENAKRLGSYGGAAVIFGLIIGALAFEYLVGTFLHEMLWDIWQ